eukprot:COSAG05_NODE_1123_length_5793_cov_4.158588_11_plen_56_part_00
MCVGSWSLCLCVCVCVCVFAQFKQLVGHLDDDTCRTIYPDLLKRLDDVRPSFTYV